MIKISPFSFSGTQQKKNNNPHIQYFAANENFPVFKDTFSQTTQVSIKPAAKESFSWLTDPTLLKSLNHLKNLSFNKNDIIHVKQMGANPPFESGKEALDFIKKSNVRIKFEALSSPKVHAQYDYENNFIKINELYKNTQNPAEILAIAEAILHEAGHAKDQDGISSIQEEIDCLSLNAISHRAFLKKHNDAFKNADSLIVKDGVCVYADLFFDNDSAKKGLLARLKDKYGFLPAGDFKHPPSNLAFKVKDGYL